MLEDDRVLFVKNINDLDTRLSGYCASLEKGKKHLILFICAGDLLKYAQLFVNGYRANVIPGELGQGCDICSRNVSLKTKTSFGCNATARVLMEPRDEKDLVKALRICGDLSLDYILLAGGSNVIFPDGIYDKAVLKLAGEYWQRIESMPNGCLRAYAGAKLSDLHAMACKEGFQCFEFLECIPGTVGGALAMNAGAHGHSISEFALNVRVFSSDGVEKILSTEECKFAYRSSNFVHGLVIACVELQLRQLDDSGGSCRKVRELTQPKGRTFGSIFKNPSGYYAGRLVEECGLKGYCRGDAAISEKHANFLVNNGEASAGDVEHVIDRARYEVFDKFGVFLETEVRLLRK
jgi:UDP-N-acetylmuramate dehydrogenase